MLERKHVAFYARASDVREEIAERDVVLTYVLRILSGSILPHLALKGGTCFKKIYFGKTGRFSMDLDFTSVDLSCEELKSRIQDSLDNKTSYGLDFKIAEENLRPDAYLAVVRYAHHWNEGSQFELQVSCREKPLLEVVKRRFVDEMYWKFCAHEFQRFSIGCLQKEEALAEKIRAAFQRMRSRDLYDLYLFIEVPHDKDAVKTLVVIKCWNARDAFDPETLLDKIVNAGQDWDHLQRLVRRGSLPSRDEVITAVLNHYGFLENLDKQLVKVVIDSKAHRERKLVDKLVWDILRQFGA